MEEQNPTPELQAPEAPQPVTDNPQAVLDEPTEMTGGVPLEEAANNSNEMSILFDQLVPQEAIEKDELTEDEVKQFSALAQDPKIGEQYWFAGKVFTRQFLSIEAEQQLIDEVRRALGNAPKGNMLLGFMTQLPVTVKATAIILGDQDPEVTEEWLKTRPKNSRRDAVTTQRMVGIIVAQLKLNEITGFLVELLALAGLAGKFAGAKVLE